MRTVDSNAALVLLLASAAGACSSAGRGVGAGRPEGEITQEEFQAIYDARTDSAQSLFTEADTRFVTGMIAHHAQALVMAEMAPTHGASPMLRTLAARIINAQQDEIALMQRWLEDRGQPVPQVHRQDGHVVVHGAGMDHAHMPGMLTANELRELERARGPDFDRLFLTYMIQHHRGAVTMVHDLFATDGAAQDEQVFKLASDIQVDQITEIERMELMLSDLPSSGGVR